MGSYLPPGKIGLKTTQHRTKVAVKATKRRDESKPEVVLYQADRDANERTREKGAYSAKTPSIGPINVQKVNR